MTYIGALAIGIVAAIGTFLIVWKFQIVDDMSGAILSGILVGIVVFCVPALGVLNAKMDADRAASIENLPGVNIVFAGKVVNAETGEWPNDRLVLLFLKGQEIGRAVTETGESNLSDEGVHDGLFSITVPNPYKLSAKGLVIRQEEPAAFKTTAISFTKLGLAHWFPKVDEGSSIVVDVPTKNIRYVMKVIPGPVSALPPQLMVAGSTRLEQDNSIVVSAPISDTQSAESINEARVQGVTYDAQTEEIEINKITVPINNCGGSAAISQDYTQTQTFIHQYEEEVGGSIGLGLPFGLVVELQAKYGFVQGQLDSRTVSYHMEAEPGTNQVYVITWKEVWESGKAGLMSGSDLVTVPFRAKTNLIYDIDSMALGCGS